jgi:Ca2+-binding RTX toxin-like protein
MTTLNISGAADVDTGAISSLALATVDASTATGAIAFDASLSNVAMTVTLNANDGGTTNFTTGDGADIITGGSGADTIVGGAGADTISGGAGVDNITGGLGADIINGGAGADNIIFTSVLDGGATGDVVTGFVSTSDNIIIDGALETAVDLAAGAAGLVTVTQAVDGTAIAMQLETTELLFLDREMNAAEANSVTSAELTNLNSVAALVDEAFVQADAGAVAARTVMVAVESTDVAGSFGLYTYVQSAAGDVTFDAAEFSLLGVFTADDLVAGDITF